VTTNPLLIGVLLVVAFNHLPWTVDRSYAEAAMTLHITSTAFTGQGEMPTTYT
jgi:hypothetical protein